MAEFPSLDFYPDAFLADTTHMSIAETGAYMNLLCVSWRIEDGGLADDDRVLSRLARATTREWVKVRPVVMAPWTLCADGKWRQKRLEIERERARERSKSAARSARARWLKNNKTGDANALRSDMRGQCENDATTDHRPPTTDVGVGGSAREPIAKPATEGNPAARAINAAREVWPDLDSRIELAGLTGSVGMVAAWLGDGAHLERDILPTITRLCLELRGRGQGPPRSFNYFRNAVANAKATNEQGLPNGQPAPSRPSRQQPSGRFRNGFAAMAHARIHGARGDDKPGMGVDLPDPDHPARTGTSRGLAEDT